VNKYNYIIAGILKSLPCRKLEKR